VGYFKRADRDSVDMYAVDLAKLGTSEDAFVDLATLCEKQEQIYRTDSEIRNSKGTNARPGECVASFD